jgi:proline-specific peptidase
VSAGGIGRPVLFLHGGPGGSSDGFAVFEGLAADRDLVLFDQLGSRTSTWSRGDDRRLWTMDRFCREVDAVRGAWGLDEVVLYGHSWGGWLGLEYLARGADGVTAVVLADTTAAFTTFAASIERRVRELSPSSRAAIAAARRTGSLDTPEYRAAAIEFYSRFVVGFVDDPVTTADAVLDRQRSSAVFQHMQGADELHADGALATWDRRDSLGAIRVPALVVVGEHDHMDVGCATELRDGLAWAELLVVERASHCPHLERPDVVLDRVGSWLPA